MTVPAIQLQATDTVADRLALLPRVIVGGLAVGAVTRAHMAHVLCEAARARRGSGLPPIYSTSANGNVLSQCARSAAFRSMIEAADIIDADGQPLVVASRLMTRTPIPERCATTDFFHDVAAAAVRRDLSMYLLGGTDEVNAAAARRVAGFYPGLRIAGRRNGYFALEGEGAVLDEINHARPDFLWVGLGVPREQQFVLRNRERLTGVGVVKTCGGLFDFLSGRASRAPQWMQDWSLEWAYRLAREPRRQLWRYATTNVHTLALLARHTHDTEQRGA
jgi:exopolysaccharide biosynthesis WecB/TagA/CpsF family protein